MKPADLRPLSTSEVDQALAQLPGWSGNQNGIEKKIKFSSFREAIEFMHACADGIDQRDHHPVWCNKYDTLEIHLDTFDAGHKVTQRDIDLAQYLESVLAKKKKAG
ncbi:MAG TPA: 4a-hydroxytetrahydrobiopterin dehydratase [Bryobacteraceae bacterium]|jgi:4a-hydroxytetrahydrobiopterin dehydratase|nr:4a-hydroxytetrahydrobiopterin dehydratase [Bryobacteraceae bacterium]